jgi:Cys-rich protein (TIGR01571 family)
MHSYDYPKVRPPSSVAAIERHTNPRSVLPQQRHFSYSQTPIEGLAPGFTRDSIIPPLPQVPAHLAVDVPPRQGTTIPELQPAQAHYFPDIKQDMYHNQPWRSAAEGQTPLHDYEQESPKSPDSAEPLPDRYIVPQVGPDENPLLTPSTPSRARTTTNMVVLTPTTPTYTPFAAPLPSVTGGTFAHDLCSCADPGTCFTSIFCPCITYGKTQYRLNQRAAKKDPTNMLGYTVVNGSCAAFAVLCGINGILAAIQHSRVRKSYHMGSEAGNMVSDCLRGCCCCCCTVAQDEKEVKRREDAAKDTDMPYQTPGRMVFAAPPR